MRIAKFSLISALVATSALSADDGLPPIIKTGFDAYAAKGPEAAWTAWGLDGTQKFIGAKETITAEDKAKFIAELSHADASFGKQIGFELIRSYDLGPSYKTVHVLWRFEKRPLFCMFVCYRDRQTWKILNFFFGSDPRPYLPESVTGMPSSTK
jgi:hypothetical protein